MKILQVIGWMNDGGAQSLVKDYARILDLRGNDVAILTIYGEENTANAKQLADLKIAQFSVFHRRNIITRMANHILAKSLIPYKLLKIINEYNPEIIHIHTSILKYFEPIHKDIIGRRLFYTCHSEADRYFGKGKEDEFSAAQILINENNMMLFALHDDMVRQLNSYFPQAKINVVKNGIDIYRFNSVKESTESIRNEIGINKDAFVLGHVGRFSPEKNHLFLLDIFCKVLQVRKESRLLLIGSGVMRDTVEKKVKELGIEDKVIILSNRTDIPRLLKCMDCFVLPSLYEGVSITLIEAQAAGKRCFVSEHLDNANFINDTTIPVSLNCSSEIWADEILNPDKRHKTGHNISEYDINVQIDKLLELYVSEI